CWHEGRDATSVPRRGRAGKVGGPLLQILGLKVVASRGLLTEKRGVCRRTSAGGRPGRTRPLIWQLGGLVLPRTVMPRSYYTILGVPETASLEEIQQAHRHLAKLYHPDRAGDGSAGAFREVQEAWE